MTDFLGDPSNGVISGMRVPRIKSANLSPVTVPYVSTNPSFDIATMACHELLFCDRQVQFLLLNIQTCVYDFLHHSQFRQPKPSDVVKIVNFCHKISSIIQ